MKYRLFKKNRYSQLIKCKKKTKKKKKKTLGMRVVARATLHLHKHVL